MDNTELPWPDKVLNPNSRKHWTIVAKAKKSYRTLSKYMAGTPPVVTDKIMLDIIFYPPCNRHRDLDNCMAMMKSALDGLADAWGVNDKAFRPRPDWGEVVKGGKVEIMIVKPPSNVLNFKPAEN